MVPPNLETLQVAPANCCWGGRRMRVLAKRILACSGEMPDAVVGRATRSGFNAGIDLQKSVSTQSVGQPLLIMRDSQRFASLSDCSSSYSERAICQCSQAV